MKLMELSCLPLDIKYDFASAAKTFLEKRIFARTFRGRSRHRLNMANNDSANLVKRAA